MPLRTIVLAFILLACFSPTKAQYYLRGEVRDQQGNVVPFAKINLTSKGDYPYYAGSAGGFGIPTSVKVDTLIASAPGYDSVKTAVQTSLFASITLRPISSKTTVTKPHLSSLTKNLLNYNPYTSYQSGESYSSTVENDFVDAEKYPETGYTVNVDRASYSNIRRFLNLNSRVPKDAVRIEEMLNYFNLKTSGNNDSVHPISVQTNVTSCPWNEAHQLLFINLHAKKIDLEKTPPSNLVFLIDVSGSMEMPNRLPLLKNSFKLLVENLRSIDTISIIGYGTDVAVHLTPTGGNEKQKILEAIEGLTAAGSTPGESAIRTAYRYASNTFIKGGNNRVILATDGDFNVGQTTEKELEDLITQERQTGIYLTCLGVGMGNYKDSKLETLARRGNGNFAYLDGEQEAEKVLVEEFAQTVYTVANDVQLFVRFNPTLVEKYRLIGFENPTNSIADSAMELEGGEVGSGHSILGVFEIIPTERNIGTGSETKNVALLSLSYSLPNKRDEKLYQGYYAKMNYQKIEEADSCLRFASAVALFGGLLKDSKLYKLATWDDVITLARSATVPNDLLKQEFIKLAEKAKKIYPRKRRN